MPETPARTRTRSGIVGSDDESPAGSTSEHAPTDEGGRFDRQREEEPPGRRPPVVGGEAEGKGPHADILDAFGRD